MQSIFRAISYFRQDLLLISAIFVMIGASVGLNLLSAWPFAILIDAVLSPVPKMSAPARYLVSFTDNNKLYQIITIAICGLTIKVLQEAVMMGRSVVNALIKYRGTQRLRAETFEKLQRLGVSWHRTTPQGDTMYRVVNDTSGPFGVLDTLIGSGAATFTLICMVAVMVSRNVELTVCALSITPFLVAVNLLFGRILRRCADGAKEKESHFTVTLQQAITYIGVTQYFGREACEQRRFNQATRKAVEGATSLAWAEALYPLVVQILFGIGAAIIIGYGGWLVYRDQIIQPESGGISCGDLMVFLAYLGQLWDPLGWVVGFPAKIQSSVASCERVFHVLDQKPHVKESVRAQHLPVAPRTLTISNLSFRYERNARAVLDKVSLTIKPGEMVAFVGASGSGKSTLLALLSRIYDPHFGSIALDGVDIREIKLSDLRRHIAVVGQESPLLPDTIAANIRYGRPEATDAEVRAAAHEAGAASFIESLPDGYETVIAENGANLSGGQRQRLAIARALASRAPILILDEPTSALDPHHQEWVLETLHTVRRSRTVVLVTHQVDSVTSCDRIFLLHEGRLVESGTHLQLLSKGGAYAKMVEDEDDIFDEISCPTRKRA